MRWPAEWEPHEAVFIGFPGNPAEWPVGLDEAQREVAAFADAVCDDGRGERVVLVCRDQGDANAATALVSKSVSVIVEPFGDIWLRDTGPIVTIDNDDRIANDFRFNGWGGKFEMAGDEDIAPRLAAYFELPVYAHDWILEGGAIDGDGAGAIITTEQCVLNPNRNSAFAKELAEVKFGEALGTDNIIWLGEGLVADHTDGHVDNLARFVAPGLVAIPQSDQKNDPNNPIFEDAASRATECGLIIVRLPSVGRYELDGAIAPASYMNFYIGNEAVLVPQYGAPNDARAVEEIAVLFPEHRVVGLPSMALLRGGGSFHCISQQIPADRK
ncbi:agmatine deiminase family protein [Parasphingorhabdus halotolerans]|uniref:Agmatine deiminase family protein n=1 Tax=Parasphingorhabdus halotolerans TaxID=2725558 RepID=A0A6H2DGX6_9SPHN|nr:agmatine deiminase family protein [Parasphingorhabdus halotolerans]QJB67922.1 agmatine deiminase family protein [Parasphingorhabdus halotolerans]